MATRQFALIFGLVLLALGLCGFFPPMLWAHPVRSFGRPHGTLAVHLIDGYLFGLFPVNAIRSGGCVFVGLVGLLASIGYGSSRFYAVVVTLVFAALFVLGLIPVADTLFGFCPLHGYDVWLDFTFAGIALAFGFLPRRMLDDSPPSDPGDRSHAT